MAGFGKAIKDRLWWLVLIFSICSFVGLLHGYLQLQRMEFLQAWTLVAITILLIISYTGFEDLGTKMDSLPKKITSALGSTQNCSHASENEKKKEETKTSGAGALGGMLLGGLLGLVLGPGGVIIGGLIGAIIGDQAERENLKGKKEQR